MGLCFEFWNFEILNHFEAFGDPGKADRKLDQSVRLATGNQARGFRQGDDSYVS
jgi:hypothetical protein